jgi:hypothetical protein
MAQSRSPRPPQHAAQSPAGSGPPGRAWLRSVRSPARARSLARFGSVRPGLGAVRGARCAVLSAPGSAGIHRPAGRRREGRRRREGARARLRVSARVSLGWCARGAPRPGERNRGLPPLALPLLPAALGSSASLQSRSRLSACEALWLVCVTMCVCVCVCVCARARVCAQEGGCLPPASPSPHCLLRIDASASCYCFLWWHTHKCIHTHIHTHTPRVTLD